MSTSTCVVPSTVLHAGNGDKCRFPPSRGSTGAQAPGRSLKRAKSDSPFPALGGSDLFHRRKGCGVPGSPLLLEPAMGEWPKCLDGETEPPGVPLASRNGWGKSIWSALQLIGAQWGMTKHFRAAAPYTVWPCIPLPGQKLLSQEAQNTTILGS